VRWRFWSGWQQTYRSGVGGEGTEAEDDDGSDLGEHFGMHACVVSGKGRETRLEFVYVGSVCLDAGQVEDGGDRCEE
jgi:hypothetical protein